MEIRKDMAEALNMLGTSFGWQIIRQQLIEDREVVMNSFMKAQDYEDVQVIKGKIYMIDRFLNLPSELINQQEPDVAESFDPLADNSPVVQNEIFGMEGLANGQR